LEVELDDPDAAIEAYNSAATQAGDQPDLLDALDRLYTKVGKAAELHDVIERRLSVVGGTEQPALYQRLV
jgi:hypothetical protein